MESKMEWRDALATMVFRWHLYAIDQTEMKEYHKTPKLPRSVGWLAAAEIVYETFAHGDNSYSLFNSSAENARERLFGALMEVVGRIETRSLELGELSNFHSAGRACGIAADDLRTTVGNCLCDHPEDMREYRTVGGHNDPEEVVTCRRCRNVYDAYELEPDAE